MRAIGIDIGTTKIAAVTVDPITQAVHPCSCVASPTLPPSFEGEHIQDADKILEIVKKLIDENWNDDVCAIGVSGAMHGIVYLNEQGSVISPLYTWQDMRGEAQAKALGIRTGYGHATHLYNAEHGLVPDGTVGYATIADAVCANLCALASPVLHASNAASLGCFDIDKNRFDPTRVRQYPYEVESAYRVVGSYRGVPVAVGIGDNQAAFLGSGCRLGEMLINVGTGSQISLLSDHAISSESIEARPGFDGYYLLCGAALCGGRAYAMLHDFFCDVVEMATGDRPADLYAAMAAYQVDAADAGLRFENTFCGTRSNPSRRGSICGISEENFTPRQFCIGLLEGMIGELAELFAGLDTSISGMVGAGNALRKNPLLQQLCEKRFGNSLYLPPYTEEAAVGAAMYALICTGHFKSAEQAAAFIRSAHKQLI